MKKTCLSVAAGYLLLLLVVGCVLLFGRVETVDEHYLYNPEEIPAGADTVTVSVDCLALEGHLDELDPHVRNELPDGLVYLSATRFLYHEGMTAFDLLLRAEKPARLRLRPFSRRRRRVAVYRLVRRRASPRTSHRMIFRRKGTDYDRI